MTRAKRRKLAVASYYERPARCPYCGGVHNAVASFEFDSIAAPDIQAGDLSVCSFCLEVMRFDGRRFGRVSAEEAAQLYEESELLRRFRDNRKKQDATTD